MKRLKLDGYRVIDTYTPFPVHGMDDAIGLKPSRLPRACLAFAILGLAIALGVQIWTSAFDYPLIVGGKPLAALPAFVPVAFELTVLMAGLGVVASLFLVSGMRPKFKVPDLHPGVNDDRFVVAAEIRAGASFAAVQSMMADLGALETELLVDDRMQKAPRFWIAKRRPSRSSWLSFLPSSCWPRCPCSTAITCSGTWPGTAE
ncbi:MAG: DUF3341 domain-containing protein [Holophagaceae bacterium]|nr:DUF3341 domain-containing protein [Holophagaceae bacterium]